jgi:phosphate transport system protein
MATQAACHATTSGYGVAAPRRGFQEELDALVDQVSDMGARVCGALALALRAFAAEDLTTCEVVIVGDDILDERYLAIQHEVLRLIARQAPVARDARLLTAAMHVSLHLERIGDLAVNVAKLTRLAAGLPQDPVVLGDLERMGTIALGMADAATRAFAERDTDACLRLVVTDDRVDALNRAVLGRVLAIQAPTERRRWAVYMDEVARQLERAGGHAVDIGEQVWFMVTGELREFTSPARDRGELRSCLR